MSTNNQKLNNYKSISVNTASPLKLVVMLYDAAIKRTEESIEKMHYTTYDEVNNNLKRVVEILDELKISLNMKAGDISHNLESIYNYLTTKINEGNLNKNTAPLEEVLKHFRELRESWHEVSLRQSISGNQDNQSKTSFSGINLQG